MSVFILMLVIQCLSQFMQVLHMHCGGSKGVTILCPPAAAGASHSIPATSTCLMQKEQSGHVKWQSTSNGTARLTRVKRVITVNWPDMRNVVAWRRAGQCGTLCQVLNHWGCSVVTEESRWLDSGTEHWMLLKAWTGRLLLSAVAGLPDVLLAGR